jgi:cell division protease FtsH
MEDRNYSDEVAYAIDQEVRRIVDDCYDTVRALLVEHADSHRRITKVLLEEEVIEGSRLDELLQKGLEEEQQGDEPIVEEDGSLNDPLSVASGRRTDDGTSDKVEGES